MRPTTFLATACLAFAAMAGTASATASTASAPRPDVDDRAAEQDPRYRPQPYITLKNPEWTKDAVLYQINTRQFTPEGTFRAAERELPRLKALGVDILWLMPVHPIGEKHRKGTLGSPYSVRDYYGVNPEFGTKADLKHFVDAAHAQGMHVILDWVANHTAWDNPLMTQHPDWYARDWKGDFHSTPWWDWTDIVNLDYSHPGLRKYMTDAMTYWVREIGVDGYRCDVAGFVPLDFWNNARAELDAIKLHERQSGHQFWRLLGYTAASVLLAFMLASALPRLAWDAPGMHERATPWVSAPISSGNRHVDDLSEGIAGGANALTPAAVMGLFALGLGAFGFVLGGLVVPESFINLRYVGWAERLCLLVAGISWGVLGMRMPALLVQFVALGLVLAVLYVVLVLPALWVFTGESPAQVYVKHVIAVDKFITPDKSRTAQAPRQGYEGYRQLMNW